MANYVDKQKLFEAIKEFRPSLIEARETGTELPRVPEYVGECILLIAQNFAKKPNFRYYSFLDDMISDAVENCLKYIHNFDPEKSENPFAYFTQITFYAFLRRIEREKKESYVKYKLMKDGDGFYDTQDIDAGEDFSPSTFVDNQDYSKFDKYENKK